MLRISALVILALSILFMPFWVSIILAFGGMIYFDIFWEAMVLFLLSDVLYGVREAKFYDMIFISFIVSAIVLVIIEVLKKRLKFYA